MHRRHFLRTASAVSAVLTQAPHVLAADSPAPARWRTFEVTTRVEVLKPSGATRIWLPTPLTVETPYQKLVATRANTPGGTSKTFERRQDGLGIVSALFPAGVKPALSLVSRVATKDVAVDLSAPSLSPVPDRAQLEYFRRPTRLLPTGGIVKSTADDIVRGAKTDVDKARAIYEWIVDNTFRNPKTLGCGLGDIRFMLESRDLGGKCADLNALYVGLARAAGLPARDAYGIRVARSELGYKSLGASSETVTKSQHCRAEVFIGGCGWVPVDPADVRKVVLEEPPGNRPLGDAMVKQARARLFGSWEMNWMAYNFAHDVALPGSSGPSVGFLMYPQAETAEGRLDSLDPDNFHYEIAAREILS